MQKKKYTPRRAKQKLVIIPKGRKKKRGTHVINDDTAVLGRVRYGKEIDLEIDEIGSISSGHARRPAVILVVTSSVHCTHETLIEVHADVHETWLAHCRDRRLEFRFQQLRACLEQKSFFFFFFWYFLIVHIALQACTIHIIICLDK